MIKKMHVMIDCMNEIGRVRAMVDTGVADEITVDFKASAEGTYNEFCWGTLTVTKEGYTSSRCPDQFAKWRK